MEEIKLKIKNYSGNFDNLLQLIKKNKIKVLDINLIEITNQYLNYIKNNLTLNINVLSQYLIQFTNLIKIKTALILKQEIIIQNEEIDEEDYQNQDEIIQRIAEYKKYKEILHIFQAAHQKSRKEISKEKSFIFIASNKDDQVITKVKKIKKNPNLEIAIENIIKMINKNDQKKMNIKFNSLNPRRQRKKIKYIINNSKTKKISLLKICINESLNFFIITLITILNMVNENEIKIYGVKEQNDIIIEKRK